MMNASASTTPTTNTLAPRPPRLYRSSRSSDSLLGHIGEGRVVASTAAPLRTKSSQELDDDLYTPYPHNASDGEDEDDDVSMADNNNNNTDMLQDDVASVGSFSHCSESRSLPVATDSMLSFTRERPNTRRHVSATDSCISLLSVDDSSASWNRFIAPSNSFTPQDIIMMEEEEQEGRLVLPLRSSSSFRLSFSMPCNSEEDTQKGGRDNFGKKDDNNKQQPALWKSLPFATNKGLPDLHASAVSYEEGEAAASAATTTTPRPFVRKPPKRREASIYHRAPLAS